MTPQERNEMIKKQEQEIVNNLISLRPDINIIKSQYKTEFVYYTVQVQNSKVKVTKNTRIIYIKDKAENLIKNKFFSEQEAREAIGKVLPMAKEKFNTILEAYKKLTNDLQFSIGYNIDGDYYGIYNEYSYIAFHLDGFDFQFNINDL